MNKVRLNNKLSIMSWNIHDRIENKVDKFKNPEFTKILEKSQIICLQETKGPIKLPNYQAFNSNRLNSHSGGVAILINNNIRKGVKHVKTTETTDAVAIKLCKTFFHLPYDVYIISLYISPAYSSFTINNPDYTEKTFDGINSIISRLSNLGQVFMCGDTNSRTACLPDYLIENSDSYFDPYGDIGYQPDLTEPRNNLDPTTNSYCTKFLDIITTNRLKILNGRTLGDCQGKLTCYKYNGCSTVDYFVASTALRNLIETLCVLDLFVKPN